jgi:hypothetical protein
MDPLAGFKLNNLKSSFKIQPESQKRIKNHNPNLINDENYMFDFPPRFHVLIENLCVENPFGIRDHDFNEGNIFDEKNLILKFSFALKL